MAGKDILTGYYMSGKKVILDTPVCRLKITPKKAELLGEELIERAEQARGLAEEAKEEASKKKLEEAKEEASEKKLGEV